MNKRISLTILLLILILLTLLVINLSSCDTTEPIDEIEPGRRDYSWTVDTLDTPDNFYYNLWGSSPADIWTVSSSNWEKSIAHFDGKKWSLNQVTGLFNMTAIYGFSSDNIFVGADNGSVWRFDGNSWKLFAKLQKEGTDYFLFQNIWGESSNDFYAFGSGPDNNRLYNKSIIAHYLNGKWIMPNTDVLKGNVVHFYKNKSNKIYFLLIKIGGIEHIDSTIIYEYTEAKYTKLYSSIETKGLQADLSFMDNEVYFILGNEIAIRKSNKFLTILKVNNPNFYQRIWGRNSRDIFLLMTDGLAHYNGSNIEYLFYFNKTPRTQIFGASLFDEEVFFLVYESITKLTLIYHGILE